MIGVFEGKLVNLAIKGQSSRLAYLHAYQCTQSGGMVFKLSSKTIGKCVIVFSNDNVGITEPDGSKLRFDNVIMCHDEALKEELS